MNYILQSILFLLLLSPSLSFGQVFQQEVEFEKVMLLAAELKLSKKSTATFRNILRKYGLESVEVLERHQDDLVKLRKSIRDIQMTQDEEVRALLKEDQFKMYATAMKKDRAQRRRAYLKKSRTN